jgi:hypothetical protein
MNPSVNAKPNQDIHIFRDFLKSLNSEYVEEKSKVYSYDFKKDSPFNLVDLNQTNDNSNSPSKALSEVKYEWQEIKPNLIGRKKRKDSEYKIKKRLNNLFIDIKMDDLAKNSDIQNTTSNSPLNIGVNNNIFSDNIRY